VKQYTVNRNPRNGESGTGNES